MKDIIYDDAGDWRTWPLELTTMTLTWTATMGSARCASGLLLIRVVAPDAKQACSTLPTSLVDVSVGCI